MTFTIIRPRLKIPILLTNHEILFFFKDFIYLFMIVTQREREAETQAEGEAGSMHREPDVGLDPGSPGSRLGPKAGAPNRCATQGSRSEKILRTRYKNTGSREWAYNKRRTTPQLWRA